jgi:hypothetical protein
MKQLIKGYVYYVKYDFMDEAHLNFATSASMGDSSPDWVLVGPHEFWVEAPDDFNPIPQQLAAIEKAKQEAHAEYHAKVVELNDRASKLLCLENSPTVEA